MMGKSVSSKREIPLYEAKEILKERATAGELTYEQNITSDYSKKFAKATKAKSEKLLKALNAIEGMTEKLAVKIVDILPADEEKLKMLLPKEPGLDEAKLKEILELVKKNSK